MKFVKREFSKRHPPVECALFIVHENYQRGFPRGTACALILPSGAFWVGVTICSSSDPFTFAVGRAKAQGRAFGKMVRAEPNQRIAPFSERRMHEILLDEIEKFRKFHTDTLIRNHERRMNEDQHHT